MIAYDVYVRAKTRDGRWAHVNAATLDEPNFRKFLLSAIANAGIVSAVSAGAELELKTDLNTSEAEA